MRYNSRYSASAIDIGVGAKRKSFNGQLLSSFNSNSGAPPSSRPMSLAMSFNKSGSQRQPKTRAPKACDDALDADDLSRRLQVVLAQQQRREAAEERNVEKKKRWSTLTGKGIPTMSSTRKDAPPPIPPLPSQSPVAHTALSQTQSHHRSRSPSLRRPSSSKQLRRKSKIFTEPVALVAKRLSIATVKTTKTTSNNDLAIDDSSNAADFDTMGGRRPSSGAYVPQQAARQFAETTTATGMRRSMIVDQQRRRTNNMPETEAESYLAVVAAMSNVVPDGEGTPEAALRQLEGDGSATPTETRIPGDKEKRLLDMLQKQRDQMEQLDAKLKPLLPASLPTREEGKASKHDSKHDSKHQSRHQSKHESRHESRRDSKYDSKHESRRSSKAERKLSQHRDKRDEKNKDLPPVPTINGVYVAKHAFEDAVSYRSSASKQPKAGRSDPFGEDPFDFGHETLVDSFDLINTMNSHTSVNQVPHRASVVSAHGHVRHKSSRNVMLGGAAGAGNAEVEAVFDEPLSPQSPVDPMTLRDRRADWTQRDETAVPPLKHQRTFEKLRSKSMWGLRSRFKQSRDENTYEAPSSSEKTTTSPRSLPISFGSTFHRSSQANQSSQPKTLKTTKSRFFGLFKH